MDLEPVTLGMINICLQVKKDIEERIERKCDVYIPVKFRPSSPKDDYPMNHNYWVKVFVGDVGKDQCVHALISQAPPGQGGKSTVKETQFPKTFKDLIPI